MVTGVILAVVNIGNLFFEEDDLPVGFEVLQEPFGLTTEERFRVGKILSDEIFTIGDKDQVIENSI